MAKVFNIFSGGKEEKNAKIKHSTPQHHAPSSSRPASAGRRPPPAVTPTPVSGIGKSLRIKPPKPPQNTEPDPYQAASREEIIAENQEFKKRIRHLEETISLQKLENQRLDNEANKQQRRIDQLLNLSEGAKNIVLSSDIRKEIEKSIFVRQLKAHVSTLRALVVEKDNEIDALRRNIKATHMSEVESERDEYYVETQRLSKIVLELQDELLREKQRKEWNNKLVGGTGEELRKEVARLASGYQSILSNIAGKGPMARPLSSGGRIGRQLTADLQSSTPDGSNKPKRPQSAVAKSTSHQHHNTYYDNGPQTPTRQAAMIQAKAAAASAPSPFFEDPLDNFGLGNSTAAAAVVPKQQTATVSEDPVVAPSAPQNQPRPSSATTRGASAGSSTASTAAAAPAPSTAPAGGPFKVGDRLQGQFKGGTIWYNATVKAVGSSADGLDPVYHIVYDDGDEEKLVPLGRLRPLEGSTNLNSANSSIAGSGSGGAKTESKKSATAALYKVGDKIEALYYKGTSFYKATVTAVGSPDGGSTFVYDVTYDDGDREKKVAEGSIRRVGGGSSSTTTTATPAGAPAAASEAPSTPKKSEPVPAAVAAVPTPPPAKFRMGEAVEGQFSGGPNWYAATVKDIKWVNSAGTPHYVYELHYADGDRERAVKEERIRTPASPAAAAADDDIPEEINEQSAKKTATKAEPSPVKFAAPAAPKFKKGDKVEGYFQAYDDWYPGVIVEVATSSSTSSGGVTYRVDYEDGDKEDSVVESRLRAKGGAAAATAPSTAPAAAVAVSSSADNSTGEPEKTDWSKVPVPEGWERKIMAGSGKVVYINHEKRETQWKHPLDTSKPTGGLFGKKSSPSKSEPATAPVSFAGDEGKVQELVNQIRRAIEEDSDGSSVALKNPKAFFAKIDRDNEGSVDKRYFTRGLKLVRINLSSQEVDLLFAKFDTGKTGLLSYDGFVELVNYGHKNDDNHTSSSGAGGNVEAPVSSAVHVTPAPYRRGEQVEGRFGGLTQWYPATIEAVNIDAHSRDYLFDLAYEDGDHETNIPAANIRPRGFEELQKLLKKLRSQALENMGGVTSSSSTSADQKVKNLFGEFDKNGKGSVDKREFKLGLDTLRLTLSQEEVNRLFERFDKNHSGGLEYVEFLDLFDLSDTSIAPGGAAAPAGTSTPSKGADNGNGSSGGGGSVSKTRGKIEIVRQASNDGYSPPESPVVSPTKKTEAVPKFKKGDKVEGYFQAYDDWYPGVIVEVVTSSSTSSGGVTYRVDYEDGDKEDSVVESRLRTKGGTAAATAPASVAATKAKAPAAVGGNDLDNFLNELSDDDVSLGALDGGRQVDLSSTLNLNKSIEKTKSKEELDYEEDFDA